MRNINDEIISLFEAADYYTEIIESEKFKEFSRMPIYIAMPVFSMVLEKYCKINKVDVKEISKVMSEKIIDTNNALGEID